jgi:hypothetical protein
MTDIEPQATSSKKREKTVDYIEEEAKTNNVPPKTTSSKTSKNRKDGKASTSEGKNAATSATFAAWEVDAMDTTA